MEGTGKEDFGRIRESVRVERIIGMLGCRECRSLEFSEEMELV